ncbi:hypothetical protein [Paenibacillus sp. R14(2021)]|uniref:hypothetical protein n=1 Tax=Paenibacillus sp. R14(2021) TaxID=2859228 RepID=UPI001C615E0B|nr:hypothetical protein [Paenibacillus sp. R14(2021)]
MIAEDRLTHKSRKMLTFALLLSVPVALSGCSTYDDGCDPDYENCSSSGGSSGSFHGTRSGSSTQGDVHSSTSGGSSFFGFGSSGHSSGG